MDAARDRLVSAKELASRNEYRFPNESAEYRRARNDLLAEEIELRRHIERVAEQRRALPQGGEMTGDYLFDSNQGPKTLGDLFGDKRTLVIYSFMYGAHRDEPCPMCTSTLDAWNGEARDVQRRVALAVVARSPIERLNAWKEKRGWRNLKLYSDINDKFSRDFHAIMPDGGDNAGLNVFTKRDGTIRHFWSAEMGFNSSDPGQDPRGAPDLMPLWTILDTTPEGRGADWYPTLYYEGE